MNAMLDCRRHLVTSETVPTKIFVAQWSRRLPGMHSLKKFTLLQNSLLMFEEGNPLKTLYDLFHSCCDIKILQNGVQSYFQEYSP